MTCCRNLVTAAVFAGLVQVASPLLAQTEGRTGFSTLRVPERPSVRLALVQPTPRPGALAYIEEQRVGDTRPPSLGVEFRPADHPAAGLLRGSVMRMQLQSGGTLALRMRSRGLAVVMKREF